MKPGDWNDLVNGQRPAVTCAPRLVHFAGGEHGARLRLSMEERAEHNRAQNRQARRLNKWGLVNYLNGGR